jgi:hypothetical protein
MDSGNLVFLLPNGRLSNGDFVRKFTKAQLRAARIIARIPPEFRQSVFRYIEMIDEDRKHKGPLVKNAQGVVCKY